MYDEKVVTTVKEKNKSCGLFLKDALTHTQSSRVERREKRVKVHWNPVIYRERLSELT